MSFHSYDCWECKTLRLAIPDRKPCPQYLKVYVLRARLCRRRKTESFLDGEVLMSPSLRVPLAQTKEPSRLPVPQPVLPPTAGDVVRRGWELWVEC
jgi:hypothetical protein